MIDAKNAEKHPETAAPDFKIAHGLTSANALQFIPKPVGGNSIPLRLFRHNTNLRKVTMHVVLCGKCRQRMSWQINTEHVTAGCPCGVRIAARYIFPWHEIPVALRMHATKTFGIRGKWRIQPLKALEVAGAVIRRVAPQTAATNILVGQR